LWNNLLKGIKTNDKTFFNYIRWRPLASKHIGPTDDHGITGALRDNRTVRAEADEPSVLVFEGEEPWEASHTTAFSYWK